MNGNNQRFFITKHKCDEKYEKGTKVFCLSCCSQWQGRGAGNVEGQQINK